MLEIWINTLFILFLLGGVTALANYADKDTRWRPVLLLAILVFNGLLLMFPLLVIATDSVATTVETTSSTETIAEATEVAIEESATAIVETEATEAIVATAEASEIAADSSATEAAPIIESEATAEAATNNSTASTSHTEIETNATDESAESKELTPFNIAMGIAIAVFGAGLMTIMLWQPAREWLARFFPKSSAPPIQESIQQAPPPSYASDMPLSPIIGMEVQSMMPMLAGVQTATTSTPQSQAGGFRPDSMVHLWAFAMTIYFVCTQLISYAMAGGLSGVAETIQVDYSTLIANFLPQIIIPLLGVGLFLRRGWQGSLERLGVRRPSLLGLLVSVVAAGGLVFTVFVISTIWVISVGEESFEQQTQASDALAESINTLGLAFMVAFTAGVGEELAFRGGLQPIFGFWFTAITFVLAHTQYTFTPATLIILVVAMVFGLIRKYMDTTTAMMTHFFYNFTLLLISLAGQQMIENGEAWFAFLHLFR